MGMTAMIKYELKILTRKLRTYVVCGALIFHFLDINPINKCRYSPDIPNYIINQTSFFTIDFASIWLMFLVADIILKEKDLKMKEILSVKPVKKRDIFLGKFSTCFLSINLMIGLIFVIAWVGEILAGFSPHLSTYFRNYTFDVLPMMAFSVALVILFSTIFKNTKTTYVFYFLFAFSNVFLEAFPRKIAMLFDTYHINSLHFSVSLEYQLLLKIILILISLGLLVSSYILYSKYVLSERGGFS